jgi:hypothetical protein
VPEPLLSSSPLTLEPHSTEDESEEDSLPAPKRHHCEMSEKDMDHAFYGLNNIIQRNERSKAQAKKNYKKLDLMDQQRGFLSSDASVHTPNSHPIMSDYESRLDYREKGGIVDYKLILSCKLLANGKMSLQDKPMRSHCSCSRYLI